MSKKIIEKTKFYDIVEITKTIVKPNLGFMETEIKEWLKDNYVCGCKYLLEKIEYDSFNLGYSLLLTHDNGSCIDEDFSSDCGFDQFTQSLSEKYKTNISVPYYYFSK